MAGLGRLAGVYSLRDSSGVLLAPRQLSTVAGEKVAAEGGFFIVNDCRII